MLLVAQLPFLDARVFLPRRGGILSVAAWPQPNPGRQFIRGFGPVAYRPHGGHDFWNDEVYYCRARHGLQVPGLLAGSSGPNSAKTDPETVAQPEKTQHAEVDLREFKYAFRRLLCSLDGVNRFEIGLYDHDCSLARQLDQQACLRLVIDLIELKVRVDRERQVAAGGSEQKGLVPLHSAGQRIARRYESATQSSKRATTKSPLIRVGRPSFLIQYFTDELHCEISSLPDNTIPVDLGGSFGKTALAYLPITYQNQPFGVWFVNQGAAEASKIRRLRLGLLRLHSEQQAIRQLLTLLETGTLPYIPGSPESAKIDAYLRDAMKMLGKPEHGSVPLAPIQEILTAYDNVLLNSDLELLRKWLLKTQWQLRQQFVAFAQKGGSANAQTQVVIQDNHGQVSIEGSIAVSGNENIIISHSQVSQSQIAVNQTLTNVTNHLGKAPAENPAVDQLKVLKDQVEKLTKDLLSVGKADDAEKAANRLESFTKEATSAKPDRDFLKITGQGLIDAAKAVAQMADPIFQVVSKILALFP